MCVLNSYLWACNFWAFWPFFDKNAIRSWTKPSKSTCFEPICAFVLNLACIFCPFFAKNGTFMQQHQASILSLNGKKFDFRNNIKKIMDEHKSVNYLYLSSGSKKIYHKIVV